MPTKRKRKSKEEVQKLKLDLVDLAKKYRPVSIRQLFYLAVSRGLIAKTETEYKGTIVKLMGIAREEGICPWDVIVDYSRRVHKHATFTGLPDLFNWVHSFYKRSKWETQPKLVHIWCEKETLLGPLAPITQEWDVPLFPCKGYPSKTFKYNAAKRIADEDKDVYIYYFGDFDPSGVDIERQLTEDLYRYTRGMDYRKHLVVKRVVVTEDQIDEFNLETRPTKKTDSRAVNFGLKSVEVEAIEPNTLRAMCEEVIQRHVTEDEWEETEQAEVEDLVELAKLQEQYI